jgi:hypothetical protein
MGLFHASKKRSIVSWSLTVSVLALVQVRVTTLLRYMQYVTHYTLHVQEHTLQTALFATVLLYTCSIW